MRRLNVRNPTLEALTAKAPRQDSLGRRAERRSAARNTTRDGQLSFERPRDQSGPAIAFRICRSPTRKGGLQIVVYKSMFSSIDSLRQHWGWLLALGLATVIVGAAAMIITPAATLATVLVLGWLLICSGVIESIYAFQARKWEGVFLHLIGGVLGVVIGLIVVTHPVAGALAWTLLFASFLTVVGIFRLVAAVRMKFPNWGWAAFDGLITGALGLLLWAEWPSSAIWFLGFAVGVSLALRGWSYVMFAMAIRALPTPAQLRDAA